MQKCTELNGNQNRGNKKQHGQATRCLGEDPVGLQVAIDACSPPPLPVLCFCFAVLQLSLLHPRAVSSQLFPALPPALGTICGPLSSLAVPGSLLLLLTALVAPPRTSGTAAIPIASPDLRGVASTAQLRVGQGEIPGKQRRIKPHLMLNKKGLGKWADQQRRNRWGLGQRQARN